MTNQTDGTGWRGSFLRYDLQYNNCKMGSPPRTKVLLCVLCLMQCFLFVGSCLNGVIHFITLRSSLLTHPRTTRSEGNHIQKIIHQHHHAPKQRNKESLLSLLSSKKHKTHTHTHTKHTSAQAKTKHGFRYCRPPTAFRCAAQQRRSSQGIWTKGGTRATPRRVRSCIRG